MTRTRLCQRIFLLRARYSSLHVCYESTQLSLDANAIIKIFRTHKNAELTLISTLNLYSMLEKYQSKTGGSKPWNSELFVISACKFCPLDFSRVIVCGLAGDKHKVFPMWVQPLNLDSRNGARPERIMMSRTMCMNLTTKTGNPVVINHGNDGVARYFDLRGLQAYPLAMSKGQSAKTRGNDAKSGLLYSDSTFMTLFDGKRGIATLLPARFKVPDSTRQEFVFVPLSQTLTSPDPQGATLCDQSYTVALKVVDMSVFFPGQNLELAARTIEYRRIAVSPCNQYIFCANSLGIVAVVDVWSHWSNVKVSNASNPFVMEPILYLRASATHGDLSMRHPQLIVTKNMQVFFTRSDGTLAMWALPATLAASSYPLDPTYVTSAPPGTN